MNKWFVIIIAVVLAVWVYSTSRSDVVTVDLVTVKKGRVESTVSNTRAGTVKACQRSRLSLPIGGQIAKLYVSEGDSVVQGQLLMSLWNDDRIANVDQAKARLNSSIKDRDSICISAKSDQREAKRLNKLAAQKLASSESADLANSKANARLAACQAAAARIAQAKASLAVTEAVLEQTYLIAPFAGKVAEVTGEIGEFSTPSPPGVPTPPAIDLLTDDCHYFSAPIDEVDAAKIAHGMPVRITMDAFRDQVFPAKVSRIATYVLDIEKQARTVEVEAVLNSGRKASSPAPAEDIKLLTGYSADMEIILDSKPSALRIPSELLIEDKFVLILDNGVLAKKTVTIGLANWHFTEITGGLNEGDKIVSNIGSQGISEGASAMAATDNDREQ